MGFNSDGNVADLGHAVFGGVLGIFGDDALALVRLGPVFLEEAFTYPPIA